MCKRNAMKPVEPDHWAQSDVSTEWRIYDKVIYEEHPFENSVDIIINFFLEKNTTTQQETTGRVEQTTVDNNIELIDNPSNDQHQRFLEKSEENNEKWFKGKRKMFYLCF